MKTNLTLALFLFLSAEVFGQASKQVLSVGTIADLRARTPQTPAEVVEVRNGSTTNLWDAPRTFVYDSNSVDTVDNVFVTTNKSAGRYLAMDRSSRVFDVKWFGAIPNDGQDDTAAITAAGNALQAAGGGTLRAGGGTYLLRGTGYPVCTFTALTNLVISADDAVFYSDDYRDETWTSVALAATNTTATAVFASPHGLAVGRRFAVKNSTDEQYEGTWTVATSNSPTVVTFSLGSYNHPSGVGTAIAHVSDINQDLFRFDGCSNVRLGSIKFEGVVQPRDVAYWLGWVVLQFRSGGSGFSGALDVTGASYGVWSGEYANNSLGGCEGFDMLVRGRSVGYPVSLWGSGHNSRFAIDAEDVHRGAYVGGVRGSDFDVKVKNFDIAGLIATHQPDSDGTVTACKDSTYRVVDTGTTEPIKLLATGGTRWLAIVNGYTATNEVAHRNLRVWVSCKDAPVTGGFLCQTFATNQFVNGLELGGYIDQTGLSSTEFRYPFFIYETASTSGTFANLVMRNLTVLQPTDPGSYRSYLRLANTGDVLFDNVLLDGVQASIALKTGAHLKKTPEFPDWSFTSYEQAVLQNVRGGVVIGGATTSRIELPMVSSLSTNDFTVQWVGQVPASGTVGLFTISPTSYATNNSFGVSLESGNLVARVRGATSTDWISASVSGWQSTMAGKVVSLGIVRSGGTLRVFTDGHENAVSFATNGTSPTWSGNLTGTKFDVGVDAYGTSYLGTVYRVAAWNSDRYQEFPTLAVRWDSGVDGYGATSDIMNDSTLNGGFETLGGGGADVFGSWDESTAGSSIVTASTNAYAGTYSAKFSVDSSGSFVGIGQSGIMTAGQTYAVSFWARCVGEHENPQIAVVGPSDGDAVITISTNWSRYTVTKVWNSTSFVLKRWNLNSAAAEIDSVTIRKTGALLDFDFTRGPGDMLSGQYGTAFGGSQTKMLARSLGVSVDRGDASANLESGQDEPVQLWKTALTAPRTVTFQTNHAMRGDMFRIVRTGAGAGSLTAGGYSIAADEAWDFVFDGSAWGPMGRMKVTSAYSGGGGTNASTVFVDSLQVDAPNFVSGPAIALGVVGTNVTPTIKTNSIGTNQLSNSALAALLNRASHTGSQDWSTITGTPTTRAGYGITDAQAAATILTAVSALAGNGVIAKTGSGTVATRTITGDSEAVVANGSGVSGDPTISIGAGIARLASPALTGTPTVNSTNLMAYIAAKQDGATILSAIAALSGNGLVAKTASGTVAARTLTGDSEIVVVNGDGVSANPTLSIGSAIARLASPALTGTPTVNGTNLMAYVAGKQDAATILSGIAALSGNGLMAKTGSGTVAARTLTGDTEIVVANGDGVSANPTLSIGAAIARLASPTFTGSPSAPTAADGTSNTVLATTAWVLRNAGSGGGGSGNANTNNSQGWAAATTNTFNGAVVFNGAVTVADLIINSATYSGVWGFANGGLGVTNATDARTVLGLVIGTDVQAYDADLLRIASVAWASGDFVYRDGTGLTNFVSTTTGRDLLSAANAAAGRTTLGTPNIAGDTFTGPVLVPYFAYHPGLTNAGSNYVMSAKAIAEKIEALSIGGYIASVDTDFQVTGSKLYVTNTVGSGRIVRESATGATASMSGLSDVSLSSTNDLHKADYFSWSGSNWVQTLGPMGWSAPDQWEEITCNFQGSWTGSGFARATISSGAQSDNANSLHGRVGYWSGRAPTSTTTLWGGANCVAGSSASLGNSNFIPTNEFFGKFEVLLPTTNGVRHVIGFHDGLDSTNAPTDALYVAVTNGVAYFVASMGGSTTKASSTYVWSTNYWHNILISATNQVATVRVTTNGVVAWQESITSANIPGGGTVATGFGVSAFTDGSGVSTNNENLLILKRCGLRYRTY